MGEKRWYREDAFGFKTRAYDIEAMETLSGCLGPLAAIILVPAWIIASMFGIDFWDAAGGVFAFLLMLLVFVVAAIAAVAACWILKLVMKLSGLFTKIKIASALSKAFCLLGIWVTGQYVVYFFNPTSPDWLLRYCLPLGLNILLFVFTFTKPSKFTILFTTVVLALQMSGLFQYRSGDLLGCQFLTYLVRPRNHQLGVFLGYLPPVIYLSELRLAHFASRRGAPELYKESSSLTLLRLLGWVISCFVLNEAVTYVLDLYRDGEPWADTVSLVFAGLALVMMALFAWAELRKDGSAWPDLVYFIILIGVAIWLIADDRSLLRMEGDDWGSAAAIVGGFSIALFLM